MNEWKETKENPIIIRPIANVKKVVDDLPGKFKEARKEIQKLKNERLQKTGSCTS